MIGDDHGRQRGVLRTIHLDGGQILPQVFLVGLDDGQALSQCSFCVLFPQNHFDKQFCDLFEDTSLV